MDRVATVPAPAAHEKIKEIAPALGKKELMGDERDKERERERERERDSVATAPAPAAPYPPTHPKKK